jgi:site-specific DNA-methyltransferase (adenine-specific)
MKDNTGRRCVKSVVEVSNKKGKGKHPTQKPDDLYEWLITRYSKEGDTILDPTAGSFASCFTAQKLGRNAIGIEKDDGFYEKAKSLAGV